MKRSEESSKAKFDALKDQLDLTTEEFKKLAKEKEELEKKLQKIEVAEGKEGVSTLRLNDLNRNIQSRSSELDGLQQQWNELNEQVKELIQWKDEQITVVKELGKQKVELELQLSELRLQTEKEQNAVKSLGNELNRLLSMKKVTEKNESDVK